MRRGRCRTPAFASSSRPSFADIFRNNAIGNGMLPVALPETAVDAILDRSEREQNYSVEVDLDRCEVRDSSGCGSPSRSTRRRGSACSRARTKST
jgi:3-isopropylmalate dehydratase small subunit